MKFRFIKFGRSEYIYYGIDDVDDKTLQHHFDVTVEVQLPNQPENADDWQWVGNYQTEEDAQSAAKYFSDTYSVVELEV